MLVLHASPLALLPQQHNMSCNLLPSRDGHNRRENGLLNSKGSAAMYGMVATIPDNAIVDDFLIGLFNELYKTKPRASKDSDDTTV